MLGSLRVERWEALHTMGHLELGEAPIMMIISPIDAYIQHTYNRSSEDTLL